MRTKRRSKRQSVVVVVATVLFAFVATMLALTRSTTEIAAAERGVSGQSRATGERDGRAGRRGQPGDAGRADGPQAQLGRRDHDRHGPPPAGAGRGRAGRGHRDRLAAARPVQHRRAHDRRRRGRDTPTRPSARRPRGGIWKSTDGGANWTSIWPDANMQAMGAIAKAPDGTLWAGTGEANPPGGGLTYFGDGIYKSTDNGATGNMGLPDSAAFGRIAVDPTNSQPRVRGGGRAHRPLGLRARRLPHRGRRQDVGARDHPDDAVHRRHRPRDPPDEPEHRLRRRCGTTGARTARASTAAAAPASSAPRTAATRGSGWRTSSTRCRPMTRRRPA